MTSCRCPTSTRTGTAPSAGSQCSTPTGSYKAFPPVYVGTGYNTIQAVTQDVLREGSRIKLTACLQDWPSGKPWNCGFRYING